MAKWSLSAQTLTPTAVADTVGMTNGGFMALQCNAGIIGQYINVIEVYCGGQATSSTVNYVQIARDSTVGASTNTLIAGAKNASLNPFTQALAAPQLAFTNAATVPQRSSTLGLLNLSFNAFGGIVRWVAAPGEEMAIYSNVAPYNEVSLSTTSGAGPMGTHIIYEPF